MASFCAVVFPLNVLDEILYVIESVSEGFLTYSCVKSLRFNPLGQFSTALSNLRNYNSMFISGFHHQIMPGPLTRLQ